jgi:hypothetical protein
MRANALLLLAAPVTMVLACDGTTSPSSPPPALRAS